MNLPILMSTPLIVTTIVICVVAAAVIVALCFFLHKHHFSSASNNLRKVYDEVHIQLTSQCEKCFVRLETLGKASEFYQNIYDEKHKTYVESLLIKDKSFDERLKVLDDLVKAKDYRQVREKESEISSELSAFKKTVSNFAADLSTLLQEDSTTIDTAIPVKSKYRTICEFYNNRKDELKGLEFSFETIIETAQNDLAKFSQLTDEAKYDEAKEIVSKLDTLLTATVDIMEQLPLLQASVVTVLPSKIDDIENTYNKMLAEGYVVYHLDIPEKVSAMRSDVETLTEKLRYLDVAGVKEKIDEIQTEITDLNAAFEAEVLAKENFDKSKYLMDDSNYNDARVYSKLMNALPEYQTAYILDQKYVTQMKNLKNDIENIGYLRRELDSYLDTSNRKPYTVIMDKMSNMRTEITKVERTMGDYKSYLDDLKNKTEGIYQGLRTCTVDLLKIRNQIRHVGIDSLLSTYDIRINYFFEQITDIGSRLVVLPLDVTTIYRDYCALRDNFQTFADDIKSRLDDASKAEQTIVYTNTFRTEYQDCDSQLRQAEKSYYECDFSRAYLEASKANSQYNNKNLNTAEKAAQA